METPHSLPLEEKRRQQADKHFEKFDFKEETVTDQGRWNEDGIYFSKPVHLQSDSGTRRVSFGVEFAPNSDTIINDWQQEF